MSGLGSSTPREVDRRVELIEVDRRDALDEDRELRVERGGEQAILHAARREHGLARDAVDVERKLAVRAKERVERVPRAQLPVRREREALDHLVAVAHVQEHALEVDVRDLRGELRERPVLAGGGVDLPVDSLSDRDGDRGEAADEGGVGDEQRDGGEQVLLRSVGRAARDAVEERVVHDVEPALIEQRSLRARTAEDRGELRVGDRHARVAGAELLDPHGAGAREALPREGPVLLVVLARDRRGDRRVHPRVPVERIAALAAHVNGRRGRARRAVGRERRAHLGAARAVERVASAPRIGVERGRTGFTCTLQVRWL